MRTTKTSKDMRFLNQQMVRGCERFEKDEEGNRHPSLSNDFCIRQCTLFTYTTHFGTSKRMCSHMRTHPVFIATYTMSIMVYLRHKQGMLRPTHHSQHTAHAPSKHTQTLLPRDNIQGRGCSGASPPPECEHPLKLIVLR